MKNKYNEFNDGYSLGMFMMARDLEFILQYLEEEDLSKDEIIELIKGDINSSLYTHIVIGGYNASEAGYDVFLKHNKIVNDRVKKLIQEELMEDK